MIFTIDDQARADRPALVNAISGDNWTYRQLRDEVNRRRDALAYPAKALVFHFCRNNLESVAWYLGAIEAGHAVALLAETLDPSLRAGLLKVFQPEFVVLPENPGEDYAIQGCGDLWRSSQTAGQTPVHHDLSLLLSTSGSTGSPKLVRLTRQNVEANAGSIAQALELTENDRPVAHLPMHYSYGLSVINSHLAVGATTILTAGSVIAADFWKSVAEHGASSFSGVPYTYQMLRRIGFARLPAAQSIVSMTQAGGKLDDKTILEFHAAMTSRNGKFWVMYGQTEAVARIAILPADKLEQKIGSAGCAIPGGSLAIATDDGFTTEPGVTGELVYRGPNVMWGYALNRADLAKGDELGGRLFTGDRASLDADGYARILGRSKRDAKIFGLRINLDDVEAMLKEHGPAAVVSATDKLIVYCEFGSDVELRQLHADVSAKLRLHTSALELRRIEKLPTGAAGKIDYSRLGVS